MVKENKASNYCPWCSILGLHFIYWPTCTTELLLKQHNYDLENELGSERDDFKSSDKPRPMIAMFYKQKTTGSFFLTVNVLMSF